MADEELREEPMRILRPLEASREGLVKQSKQPIALLIYVLPIGGTEAEPATRENSNATQKIHGVVLESVFRATTNILNRLHFSDDLEVLVNREVEADASY